MDFDETFMVPSFIWNLIFIHALDKYDFSHSFRNRNFSLLHNSNLVGSGSFSGHDNLYLTDSIALFNEYLQVSTRGIKKKINQWEFSYVKAQRD